MPEIRVSPRLLRPAGRNIPGDGGWITGQRIGASGGLLL
jgi:hypothetical protein